MKDQKRKLIQQDGYWFLVERNAQGMAVVTITGIPATTPRKEAIAQLKRAGQ